MNIEKIKRLAYRYMIDNNTLICEEFQDYLETTNQHRHYGTKALKVLELNWKYRVCRKKSRDIPYTKLSFPEYRREERPSVDNVVRQIEDAEVVSFDIFDTLIFRAVEKPIDVFRLLEAKWNIFGFANSRKEAERRARENGEEISIYDIYDILEKELAIDKDAGIALELQMEKDVCYPNPYMKQVFEKVKEKKKKIIVTSDMYFPEVLMKELLESCGYEGIDNIYVSCDLHVSKYNGQLQRQVEKNEGIGLKYIHIGDNELSDIKGSEMAGWKTIHYKNIDQIGHDYRRRSMKTIGGSFYKGLVNAKLHSGLYSHNELYEYGYVYGGIMAAGYCQYLKELETKDKIDQFIFVARDGYIIHNIYKEYDPEMACAYVPFSRFASYIITMERNWKYFFKHVVLPRTLVAEKETLEQVIEICDMEYVKPYLEMYDLKLKAPFVYEEYEKLYRLFEENIHEITKCFENDVEAARQYFRQIIGIHKKVCIVDVGWQGTGAFCLKYFLEDKCGMDIQVCGALMGAVDNSSTDLCISNHSIFSYMFSMQENYDMMLKVFGKHNECDFRKFLIEILFTEDKPSFIKYTLDQNGELQCVYGIDEQNGKTIESIQRGIYDFAMDYFFYEEKFGDILHICGREAYMPIDALAEDKKYCIQLLGDYRINENSGLFERDNVRTFKEIIGRD